MAEMVVVGVLTVIEDGDDPKADRKRWIGTWYPCLALDYDESAAIEEWVWSVVIMENVWFLVSFLGGDAEETSLLRRSMMVWSSSPS